MEIVYAFIYNPCIYESAPQTVSLHRTRKGAELAMELHKEGLRKEFEEYDEWSKENGNFSLKFGKYEYWGVTEIEIND